MSDNTSTTLEAQATGPQNRSSGYRLIALLVLAGAARLAWLAILPRGALSLDLLAWKAVALALIHHLNPYQVTPWLNHPPFWMGILYLLAQLSVRHGVDFILAVRLALIVGDMALLAATFLLLRTLQPDVRHTRWLIVGYCLNPLLVLLTVQHGNFDSFCMIGIVLFLCFIIRDQRTPDVVDWLCAAGCLGLAVFVKQFALVLWPLLTPGARQRGWRGRVAGLFLLTAPAIISLAPLYALAPDAIVRNVLLYRSLGNTFGLVGLLSLAGYDKFLPLYAQVFTAIVLAGSVTIAIGLWRRNWRLDSDPVLFSAMILLALFTLGPGYGSQYWFWIVPLILVCYSNCGPRFRRVIWLSMAMVTATNIFEYAVERNLGRFLFNFCPSSSLRSLSDFFPYPSSHLIWLRMPMTVAALFLLSSGLAALAQRYPKKPIPA